MVSHLKVSVVAFSLALGLAIPAGAGPATPAAGAHQNAQVQAKVCLKNLKRCAVRVRSVTLDIMDDVQQRPMEVTWGDPLFIVPPAYDQKDSKVYLADMKQLGTLEQPHKRWIDADMARLASLITVLNAEMKEITVPAGTAPLGEMKTILNDVDSHYKQLQVLTVGPRYDNMAIGVASMRIYDDMAKLEKPWKATLKAVH